MGKCLKIENYLFIKGSVVEGDEDKECIAIYSNKINHKKINDYMLLGHIILDDDFEYVFVQAKHKEKDTFLYFETLNNIARIMEELTYGIIKYDQKTKEFEIRENV